MIEKLQDQLINSEKKGQGNNQNINEDKTLLLQEQFKNQNLQSKVEDMKGDINKLDKELKDKERELQDLKTESFKDQLKIQTLEQQVADLKKNISNFEQGMKGKEGMDLLLSQLQNDINQKSMTIESLKSQLFTYQHKPNFEEQQMESLKKELRKTQDENS